MTETPEAYRRRVLARFDDYIDQCRRERKEHERRAKAQARLLDVEREAIVGEAVPA